MQTGLIVLALLPSHRRFGQRRQRDACWPSNHIMHLSPRPRFGYKGPDNPASTNMQRETEKATKRNTPTLSSCSTHARLTSQQPFPHQERADQGSEILPAPPTQPLTPRVGWVWNPSPTGAVCGYAALSGVTLHPCCRVGVRLSTLSVGLSQPSSVAVFNISQTSSMFEIPRSWSYSHLHRSVSPLSVLPDATS